MSGGFTGLQYSLWMPIKVQRFEDLQTDDKVPLNSGEQIVVTAENKEPFRVLAVELAVEGADLVIIEILRKDDSSTKTQVIHLFG